MKEGEGTPEQHAALAEYLRPPPATPINAERVSVSSTDWLERIRDLESTLSKYVVAMDGIYNHNEAARAAVIAHFGIHHLPGAMRSNEEVSVRADTD